MLVILALTGAACSVYVTGVTICVMHKCCKSVEFEVQAVGSFAVDNIRIIEKSCHYILLFYITTLLFLACTVLTCSLKNWIMCI